MYGLCITAILIILYVCSLHQSNIDVLLVVGGGTSLAAVSHLIEEGVTKLLEARGSPAGAAHEATLLAALRLLSTALETDLWLLQELRQHPATGKSWPTFTRTLLVAVLT